MPELPEVETVCRGLSAKIIGDSIASAIVLRQDSIGYPAVKDFIRQVPKHRFESISRRGKYILIALDKRAALVVHLRMSGRLLLVEGGKATSPFLRVRLLLKSGRELQFEDMRVFGRIWYVPPSKTLEQIIPTLSELGIEPLTQLSEAVLKKLFQGRKQLIKSALLDQRLIAGIGNIYADESLFQAGINPLRAAGSLSLSELAQLCQAIRDVLGCAIESGGTTLRDYTDSDGVNGRYQHQSWVYGRTGEACRVCKKAIARVKIGGRSSHYCPQCQVGPRPRSKAAK